MTERSTWLLAGAVATAVVTVSAAAIVWNDRVANAPVQPPTVQWRLDAADTYGRDFAQFLDPTTESQISSSAASFIEADGLMVTLMALRNQETGALDGEMLVAIDSADGSVRWRTEVDDIGACASQPVAGTIFCNTGPYSDKRSFVAVDLATGDLHRTPTTWYVVGVVSYADAVFVVEGNPEDNDIRVHSGTPDDPDSHWTSAFDLGAGYEDLYGQSVLRLGYGLGAVVLGSEAIGFDLATGRHTWERRMPDCTDSLNTSVGSMFVRVREDCSGTGSVTGTEILDATGRVIAESSATTANRLVIDQPSDKRLPVLLGDGGYDRRTGERRWTSRELVERPAVAVVGDVALLGDRADSGLDLRTGTTLWQHEPRGDGGQQLACWSDEYVVEIDYEALTALDVRSGKTAWQIRYDAMGAGPRAQLDEFATVRRAADRMVYATNTTMIALS